MVGVSVGDTTLGTLVANLGYDKLLFPTPVFVGDTLAQSKASASRCAKASRGPMPASSPGSIAASTSATSWSARCSAPRCCRRSRNDRAAQLAVRPRRQQQEDGEGAGQRRRRGDLRPGGQRRAGAKAGGREIAQPLPQPRRRPERWVRVNPLGSEIIKDDLELLDVADIHGIVLPKAECGDDVADLAHRTGNLPIHAIVTETAAILFGLLSYRDAGRRWPR